MDIKTWFSKITSDGHLPIGFFIFVIGSAIHVFHGLDPAYVAFSTTVLGFLGGHAWVQSNNKPDGQ
jgi:hypothetical protein